MAFKLTKEQSERIAELAGVAQEKGEALQQAIEEFNEKIEEMFAPVEQAVEAMNEVQSEIRSYVEEMVGDWRAEWEDKSDKWQESEKGTATSAWIDEWEQWAELDEISVEKPEPLEVEIPDLDDTQPMQAP
jgi:hypothetical protein